MRRAVVVRHPLDRLVSLWHHRNAFLAYQGNSSPTFEAFVDRLEKREDRTNVFCQTISELLSDTRIDDVVYYEHLEADLRRIGLDFDEDIPQLDSSIRRSWRDYYSANSRLAARRWAKDDFERFGYHENGLDREPIKANYLKPRFPLLNNRRELLETLPKNATCAEIGVFCGDFSAEILEVSNPQKLFLLDQWSDSHSMQLYGRKRNGRQALLELKQKLKEPLENGQVELRRGDSLSCLAEFPDRFFDWIYLDTSHVYYDTFAELCLCAQKLKPEGYLCGHDYCEIFEHGVVRAVDLFCRQFEFELVYLTNEPKLPALYRFGVNATVPPRVSYNSFALKRKVSASI